MQERATWRIWVALLFAVALQTTWLARWRLFGAHVDLPLMTVISVALLAGWEIGALYGLVAGLLTGYVVGANVGAFALSRLVVGGTLGALEHRFSHDNPFAPPLCAAGAVVASSMILLVMSPTDFSLAWWTRHTLVSVCSHALLILPVHWLMARFVLPPARTMFT